MNKNMKKVFASVISFFAAFSLNFVSAERSSWDTKGASYGSRLYKRYTYENGKPRIMIIGAGRGVLRFGSKVFATEYDEYAYGDKKYDYFLVDACRSLRPDYVCNAKSAYAMSKLGFGTWDQCFLEFLPHHVCMDGALKNAVSLVKPGGKVYMNAIDFFNKGYDSCCIKIPRRFLLFIDYFKRKVGVSRKGPRPDFCIELSKQPEKTRGFFRYVYGLGDDVASIKLVPRTDENWPSKNKSLPSFYIWEITKAG